MSLWAKHSQEPDLEYHSLLWPRWTLQLDWNRLKATLNKDSGNQFNWSYSSWNSDTHFFVYKKRYCGFWMQESSPDGNKVSFLWCPARALGLLIAVQFCTMCAFCLPRAKVIYPVRLFYKIAHTDLKSYFLPPECSGGNLVKQCVYVSKKMPSLELCPGRAASMLLPTTNEE